MPEPIINILKTKRGRNTMYTPELAEQAKELVIQGENAKNIAAKLGIHRQTFYYWVNNNPGFLEKLNEGGEILWTSMGIKLIELMTEGLCKIEVAAKFGVCESVLDNWISDENKLKPYWEVGHTASFAWWWQRVRTVLNDPKANKAAVALLIWSMKVRFGLFDNLVMERITETIGVSDKEIVEAEVRLKRIFAIERKQKGQEQIECNAGTGKEENN